MYLLDTNVVSEFRKAKSGKIDKKVDAWANTHPVAMMYLSVVTVLELEMGVLLMEMRDMLQGERLRAWLDTKVMPAFANRILSIDTAIAKRCATLHVPDRKSDRDALIAATALVHGISVVTRNVSDFLPTGVNIINPWE